MNNSVLMNISLVMYGIKKCSGKCLYCSAASTMNYRDSKNKTTFRFDKEKTRKKILEYTGVEEVSKKSPVNLHVDVWGGNPIENFNEFKQVVEFLQNDLKEFSSIEIHTSGNGLELQSTDIVNYLIENNIGYQLSHDGLGQYIRTGEIDPLYWDKTAENIVNLTKLGLLDWINCTLNNRNYSFFENKKYFDDWMRANDLLDTNLIIKLNHLYPGTPPVEKKWTGKDIQALHGRSACKNGELIGDLAFNDKNLIDYMHEFRKIGIICLTPGINNSNEWKHYSGYILNQINRWGTMNSENEGEGICRKFQMGIVDKTFAIDTLGEYCQCNLLDSSTPVKNPKGTRTKECETCVYSKQRECHLCGSEVYEDPCKYLYQNCQVLEEFAQLKWLLDEVAKNNSSNCENNGCCCNEKNNDTKEPIYCIKNYSV